MKKAKPIKERPQTTKEIAKDLIKQCQLKTKGNQTSPQDAAILLAAATIASAILVNADVKRF